MATIGFEFAYNVDGTGGTPVIRDFILGEAAAHTQGDLMLVQSDGFIDAVTGTTTEVTGIMQETLASGDVTAGTTNGKMAIITRNQVWRCSTAATTTTAVLGFTKTLDTVDANTIDGADISSGAMIPIENTALDDDGNILMYVVFADTTFGNT